VTEAYGPAGGRRGYHPGAPAALPRADQARIIPDMGVVSNGWVYFFNRRVTGLKYSISGRLFKNDEMQGARTLRNEAYNPYAAMTKDIAQRRGSRFSTAW